jgi:hypothetical protein
MAIRCTYFTAKKGKQAKTELILHVRVFVTTNNFRRNWNFHETWYEHHTTEVTQLSYNFNFYFCSQYHQHGGYAYLLGENYTSVTYYRLLKQFLW